MKKDDPVEMRQRPVPVVVVAHQHRLDPGIVLLKLERAGPHRVQIDVLVAPLLHRGRAHHQRQAARQRRRELVHEMRPGPIEHQLDRVLAGRAYLGEIAQRSVAKRGGPFLVMLEVRIDDPPEVEYHRLGVEGGPVVELHPLAQMERVNLAVRRDLPGFRQSRHERRHLSRPRAVAVHQALEDLQHDPLVAAAEDDMRVVPGDLALDAIDERAPLLGSFLPGRGQEGALRQAGSRQPRTTAARRRHSISNMGSSPRWIGMESSPPAARTQPGAALRGRPGPRNNIIADRSCR